jgi:hypothetical protein
MVTEIQRLQLLAILSYSTHNQATIIKKLKELHGIELTPQQLNEHINKLKQARGV